MTDKQMPAGGEFRDDRRPPFVASDGIRSHRADSDRRVVARWWSIVLDGRHDWGSFDVSPTRHGVTRYRLVVYPPGVDTLERRLLRAWRSWPTWGALLWLVTQILLGALFTPGAALAVSTIAYLLGGAVLFARVAEIRSRVRTLSVVRMAGYVDERSAATFTEVKTLVAALCQADAQRAEGRMSPADHESAWWQVYDRLGQNHPGPVPC